MIVVVLHWAVVVPLHLCVYNSRSSGCLHAQLVPQVTDVVPQVTDVVPQVTDVVPQVTDVVPQVTDVVPQVTDVGTLFIANKYDW